MESVAGAPSPEEVDTAAQAKIDGIAERVPEAPPSFKAEDIGTVMVVEPPAPQHPPRAAIGSEEWTKEAKLSGLPWSDQGFKTAVIGGFANKLFREEGFSVLSFLVGSKTSYAARKSSLNSEDDEIVAYGCMEDGQWYLTPHQGNGLIAVSSTVWPK